MAEKNLATLADFNGTTMKYLTQNMDNVEIDVFIREAQRLDIKPFIGDPLYYATVEAYPDGGIYDDLVDGGDYVIDNKTIYFDGLKAAILHYAHARYLEAQDATSTQFGIVRKINEFSEPITGASLRRKIDAARSSGYNYLEGVRRFLNENSDVYPLWGEWCRNFNQRASGPTIRSVGRRGVNLKHNRNTRYNG